MADSDGGRTQVWMVNHYAKRFPTSGGTRHHFLARGLARHGMDTTILTAQPLPAAPVSTAEDAAVTFHHVPARPYRGNGIGRMLNMLGFAWGAVRVGWRPARHGVAPPDIVIGSTPHPFAAVAAWVIARKHHVPFLFEVRDLWPESLVAILHLRRWHPVVVALGLVERFLYSHADGLIGVLQGVGDHARMRVGRRAPEAVWIPNGVALELLPDVHPVRAPADGFRVVYTGAHGPPNSLHTLLEAAAILQRDDTDSTLPIRFDLYGDGVVKGRLVEQARRLRLTNVAFHDPVPKDQVYAILDAADATVLLLPRLYLWRFGISPNKLFDYLAAARPTILAVDAPGDPVTAADAGLRATGEDPADLAAKLRELRDLPLAERRAMGERGRAYAAAHHDMPRLADRLARMIGEYVS